MTDQQQPDHDPMPLRGVVAFLRSCTRSGAQLTAEDDAMIDRALEAAKKERDHARAEVERLRAALAGLMRRLDDHFGGPDRSADWQEQEQAREALAAAAQGSP